MASNRSPPWFPTLLLLLCILFLAVVCIAELTLDTIPPNLTPRNRKSLKTPVHLNLDVAQRNLRNPSSGADILKKATPISPPSLINKPQNNISPQPRQVMSTQSDYTQWQYSEIATTVPGVGNGSVGQWYSSQFQIIDPGTSLPIETFTNDQTPLITFTVESNDPDYVPYYSVHIICTTSTTLGQVLVQDPDPSLVFGCDDYSRLIEAGSCTWDQATKSFYMEFQPRRMTPNYLFETDKFFGLIVSPLDLSAAWAYYQWDIANPSPSPKIDVLFMFNDNWVTLAPAGTEVYVGSNLVLQVTSTDLAGVALTASQMQWFEQCAPLVIYPNGTDLTSMTTPVANPFLSPQYTNAQGQSVANGATFAFTDVADGVDSCARTLKQGTWSLTVYSPMTIDLLSSFNPAQLPPSDFSTWPQFVGSRSTSFLARPATTVSTPTINKNAGVTTVTFNTMDIYGNISPKTIAQTSIVPSSSSPSVTCPPPTCTQSTDCCLNGACTFTIADSAIDVTVECTYTITGFKTITGKWADAVVGTGDATVILQYTEPPPPGTSYALKIITTTYIDSIPYKGVSQGQSGEIYGFEFQIQDQNSAVITQFDATNTPFITLGTIDSTSTGSNGYTIDDGGDEATLHSSYTVVCGDTGLGPTVYGETIGCADYTFTTLGIDCVWSAESSTFQFLFQPGLLSPKYLSPASKIELVLRINSVDNTSKWISRYYDISTRSSDHKHFAAIQITQAGQPLTLGDTNQSVDVGVPISLKTLSLDPGSNPLDAQGLGWLQAAVPIIGYPNGTDLASIVAAGPLTTPAFTNPAGQSIASGASFSFSTFENPSAPGCMLTQGTFQVTFYQPMLVSFLLTSHGDPALLPPKQSTSWDSFVGTRALTIKPAPVTTASVPTATTSGKVRTVTFNTFDKYGNPTAGTIPRSSITTARNPTSGTTCPTVSCTVTSNCCTGTSCTFTITDPDPTTVTTSVTCTYTVGSLKTITGKWANAVVGSTSITYVTSYTAAALPPNLTYTQLSRSVVFSGEPNPGLVGNTEHIQFQIKNELKQVVTTFTADSNPTVLITVQSDTDNHFAYTMYCQTSTLAMEILPADPGTGPVVGCTDFTFPVLDPQCLWDNASSSFILSWVSARLNPLRVVADSPWGMALFIVSADVKYQWVGTFFDVGTATAPTLVLTSPNVNPAIPGPVILPSTGVNIPVGTKVTWNTFSMDLYSNALTPSEMIWFVKSKPLIGYPKGTDLASFGTPVGFPLDPTFTPSPAVAYGAISGAYEFTTTPSDVGGSCTITAGRFSLTIYQPMTLQFLLGSFEDPAVYPPTNSNLWSAFTGTRLVVVAPLPASTTSAPSVSTTGQTRTVTFNTLDAYGNPTAATIAAGGITVTSTLDVANCPTPTCSGSNCCTGSTCTFTFTQSTVDRALNCKYSITGYKTITGKWATAVVTDQVPSVSLSFTPAVEYLCTFTDSNNLTPTAPKSCDDTGITSTYCNTGPLNICKVRVTRGCYLAGTTNLAYSETYCTASTQYKSGDLVPIVSGTCPSGQRDLSCTTPPYEYQCTYTFGPEPSKDGDCNDTGLQALYCNAQYSVCTVSLTTKCVSGEDGSVQPSDQLCFEAGAVNAYAGMTSTVAPTCSSSQSSPTPLECYPRASPIKSTFAVPAKIEAVTTRTFTLPINNDKGEGLVKTTSAIVLKLVSSDNFIAQDCVSNVCFVGTLDSTSPTLAYDIVLFGDSAYTVGNKWKFVCTIDGTPCQDVHGVEMTVTSSKPVRFEIKYFDPETNLELTDLQTTPFVPKGTEYKTFCTYASKCLLFGHKYNVIISLFDKFENKAAPPDSAGNSIDIDNVTDFFITYSARNQYNKRCSIGPDGDDSRYDLIDPNYVPPQDSLKWYAPLAQVGCYWDVDERVIKLDYVVPYTYGVGADPAPLTMVPAQPIPEVVTMGLAPGTVWAEYLQEENPVINNYGDNKILKVPVGTQFRIMFDPDPQNSFANYNADYPTTKQGWLPPSWSKEDSRLWPYDFFEPQVELPACPDQPNVGASLATDFTIHPAQGSDVIFASWVVDAQFNGALSLNVALAVNGKTVFAQAVQTIALAATNTTTPTKFTQVTKVTTDDIVTYPHVTTFEFYTADIYGNDSIESLKPSQIISDPTNSATCPTVTCPNDECCEIDTTPELFSIASSFQINPTAAEQCPTITKKKCAVNFDYSIGTDAASCTYTTPFYPSHGFNKKPAQTEEFVTFSFDLPTKIPSIYQYRCTISLDAKDDEAVIDPNVSSVYAMCSDLALQNSFCSSISQACSLKTVSRLCFDVTNNVKADDLTLCTGGNADLEFNNNTGYNSLVQGESFEMTISACPPKSSGHTLYDLKCPLEVEDTPPEEIPEPLSATALQCITTLFAVFVIALAF